MDSIEKLLHLHERWQSAMRRNAIPEANRHGGKMSDIVSELREAEEGRHQLERLMDHPVANIRLWAAGSVVAWAPEAALPVLARLLHEPLDPEGALVEKVSIRIDAGIYLADHFGMHPADMRALPERLAAVGIELPADITSRLQR